MNKGCMCGDCYFATCIDDSLGLYSCWNKDSPYFGLDIDIAFDSCDFGFVV